MKTVGDLLDRPRIVIPVEWPRKTGRLVGQELAMICEDLGEPFEGSIVLPPAVAAEHHATGTVAERWSTITAWLAEHHPAALRHWNGPASDEAIAETEAALGVTLPDDYGQFLRLANGQKELTPMVGLGSLLPVEELPDAQEGIFGEETPIAQDEVGPGIRAVDYAAGWIPISRSSRGRDFKCLDLDPAPGGTVGQVIEYIVDFRARALVARTFADLLSLYFEGIQTGEIDLEEGAYEDEEGDDEEGDDDDEDEDE